MAISANGERGLRGEYDVKDSTLVMEELELWF